MSKEKRKDTNFQYQKWKFPNIFQLGNKYINKLGYSYIMEYYSEIKSSELPIYAWTWMNLKCIMLSKWRQNKEAKYYTNHLNNILKKVKVTGTKNKSVVAMA